MKITSLLVCLFLSVSVFAQKVTHELDHFSEVRVSNGIKLILKEAKFNRAEVTGESRGEVQFKQERGILKVKLGIDHIWDDDDDTMVTLYFTDLEKITARQSAEISVEDQIKQRRLDLQSQEGSVIIADIKVEKLNSDVYTGGKIELSGKALTQKVTVKAGGQYYAKDVKSETIDINISAGGVADITAEKLVDAKVRAGGTVNVYGDPEVIEKDTMLGGTITRKN